MKLFFTQNKEGKIMSWATIHMKEADCVTYEFEVDETDEKLVNEGVKDWVIVDGQLSTVDSDRKEKREQLEVKAQEEEQEVTLLKTKLETGQATLEETQKLLAKLL